MSLPLWCRRYQPQRLCFSRISASSSRVPRSTPHTCTHARYAQPNMTSETRQSETPKQHTKTHTQRRRDSERAGATRAFHPQCLLHASGRTLHCSGARFEIGRRTWSESDSAQSFGRRASPRHNMPNSNGSSSVINQGDSLKPGKQSLRRQGAGSKRSLWMHGDEHSVKSSSSRRREQRRQQKSGSRRLRQLMRRVECLLLSSKHLRTRGN